MAHQSDDASSSATSEPGEVSLRANAMGLSAVLMQAITHIGPAIGLATTIAFVTGLVGVTSPLAYGFAFLLVLTIGASLTRLAKNFPSAGGYFTYVSKTIHPRAGALTGWLYFIYDPLVAAILIAYFGFVLQGFLQADYNFDFPWWATFVILAGIVTACLYCGIQISAKALLILGGLEIAILAALAVSGLASPGAGGTNLTPFNPQNSLSSHGMYLAVVFSITSFTGFESVAPLAEEARDPRRTVPRAIMFSIILMGLFFLLVSWGIVVGWGTAHAASLASSAQNPLLLVARRLWGIGWIFVMLAIGNSALACGLAGSNAATRVFYGMARSGALPKALSAVHPRFKTPTNAIHLQTVITFVFGLVVGFWIGADQEYYVTGLALTLALILIYGAGNIGVIRYQLGRGRADFNLWLDAVFPVLSTAALLWVGYKSIVPLPASPVLYAPYIAAGWLVAGVGFVWLVVKRGDEARLRQAAAVAYEGSLPPERAG
jgi:amino acid transporter